MIKCNMRLQVLLLAFLSACSSQEDGSNRVPRSPQGHIKYSDPSGLKVNWKLYAPHSQWKSHLERSETKEQPEMRAIPSSSGQMQSQLIQPQIQPAEPSLIKPQLIQYKPYSHVPAYIKQLLLRSYEPQAPYVDPEAFAYQATPAARSSNLESQAISMQYQPFMRSQITEKNSRVLEERQPAETDYQPQYQTSQSKQQAQVLPVQSVGIGGDVSAHIHQLLQFQAQIPYNVIANHIIYRPSKPFIPELLAQGDVGSYQYRSKVYRMDGLQEIDEGSTIRPVKERQSRE